MHLVRSVMESLRLDCPRHKRVDSHVSLSTAFASADTSLLSLFCSLNLLKCMLKDSSIYLLRAQSLPVPQDWHNRHAPFCRRFCTSFISNQGRSHALRNLHMCKYKLWLGSKSLHKVLFAKCSASHFLASSQTRTFWRESHVLWTASTWFVWRGTDLSALPSIFSSATPSQRLTSPCPPLLHHQQGT